MEILEVGCKFCRFISHCLSVYDPCHHAMSSKDLITLPCSCKISKLCLFLPLDNKQYLNSHLRKKVFR